ncbi:hypothetical protein SDC9_199286 [bioreactor metagenome]|uniref:Uncharacterized protein n=1 Tax=bioreactor metagenome TaxID=1076179 RepID=A0A645IK29_9ZZZZ
MPPFGAAFLHLNNSVLFEITQEPAPAAFVERRDVFGDKVADPFLPFFHLTDIDRFIAR